MNKEILIGIHKAIHDKVDPELEVYRKILIHNNINYIDLDSSDPDFWKKIRQATHFIYKWSHGHSDHQIAHAVIPIIQYQLQLKCFPNWETSWHYDDKIKQAYLLEENGFPICESYIFFNKKKAQQWLERTELPVVFKLKSGSGSMNVQLIFSKSHAKHMINKMFGKGIHQDRNGLLKTMKTFNFNSVKIFRYYGIKLRNLLIGKDTTSFWQKQKNYVLFQKFMPKNDYDTRVQITGKRAFAYLRYNRPNDFRASGSNNWSLDHKTIDMEMVKIAFNVSQKLGFQSMAYDFIYDHDGKPGIVEMSYCFGDYPEFSNGYWQENLEWIPGRFLPQYFELMDLLGLPDLKLPDHITAASSYRKVKIP